MEAMPATRYQEHWREGEQRRMTDDGGGGNGGTADLKSSDVSGDKATG